MDRPASVYRFDSSTQCDVRIEDCNPVINMIVLYMMFICQSSARRHLAGVNSIGPFDRSMFDTGSNHEWHAFLQVRV